MFKTPTQSIPRAEFVVLVAILTSQVALSIDVMLPALPDIGHDLGVVRENDRPLVLSVFFFGLAFGQIISGPISDAVGRRPVVGAGMVIFVIGCLLSMVSDDFRSLLAGRFCQGLGIAGPRIVTMAIVRDQYAGRGMAQIMSVVMAIFIIVPALAPLLGLGIMKLAGWRAIFGVLLGVGIGTITWFWLRQPETLSDQNRRRLVPNVIFDGFREIFTNRITVGYTISAGLIFGAFLAYLNSSQQIFADQFDAVDMFPIYFGLLSLPMGAASILNSRHVMRLGMRHISWRALVVVSSLSGIFFVVVWLKGGDIPLWGFMVWGLITFFFLGLLFANINALAMEPMGHIAGIASATVTSGATMLALILGAIIGRMYDGTVLPLLGGFTVLYIASLGVMALTEAGRKTG